MSNKPTHKVLTAIEQKGSDKPYWHRVGSAWAGDKTIKIKLNSFPVSGEMNLFAITEKVDGEDRRRHKAMGAAVGQWPRAFPAPAP